MSRSAIAEDRTPPPGRGRPRDAAKRAAAASAALELVQDGGLAALTMERIAERAGVSKVTLYRWWRHRAEIALDGLLDDLEPGLAWPDSGDFPSDLHVQVQALVGALGGRRGIVIRAVIGAGQEDPAVLRAFIERFIEPRRADARAAFGRAQQGGLLRADLDPEIAIDLVYGPLYYRLLVQHRPVSTDFGHATVNAALRGIAGELR